MLNLLTAQEILKTNKAEMQERFHLKSIGLFGSIVRNDFTAESDVDIIVEFNQSIGMEFIDLANFLESKIHRKIDLVSKKGLKQNFYVEIENQIIYV
jgi:uncharacterized protein